MTPKKIYNSITFYPLTILYAVGVLLVILVANRELPVLYGVVILSITALFVLLLATWRELKLVHKLVNGQRSELIGRIDELTALLIESGVVVPPSGSKEQDARDDARREQDRNR